MPKSIYVWHNKNNFKTAYSVYNERGELMLVTWDKNLALRAAKMTTDMIVIPATKKWYDGNPARIMYSLRTTFIPFPIIGADNLLRRIAPPMLLS